MQTPALWHLKGTVVVACSCNYGCPCNFNARPTFGHCEGGWTWIIAEGQYGTTALGGLAFSLMCDWPAAIHEGNGEAVLLVDERATDAQREAIRTLAGGGAGGPWEIVATTLVKVHGPRFVEYSAQLEGARSKIRAGSSIDLELEPIRNPVTGAEAHPRVSLPQGFIFKEAAFASSKKFLVRDGVRYDHSGQHASIGPFEYRSG